MNVQYFASIISDSMNSSSAVLVNGMLLGTPVQSNPLVYRNLRINGLLHMVVLSGTNISFLESWISHVTLIFSKKISILLTLICMVGFIILVGFQAPVMRAFFMNMYTSVAVLLGKKPIPLVNLLFSLFLIAILWPQWIFSTSLLLSYGATLGLLLFRKKAEKGETKTIVFRLLHHLTEEIRISIAAQVFIIPIMIVCFHQISLISPISNAVVSWLVPYIMITGFFIIVFHFIFPPLAYCFGFIAHLYVSLFYFLTSIMAKIPFAAITVSF